MLRFPNPSSTIHNFVTVYRVAYQELAGRVVGIDDIVEAVVGQNLATSSGHTGDQAIARSTRQDRSRDPLYNQIKMYAELFRALGWLHPTRSAASLYTFTPLGGQIVIAGRDYPQLLGESALGIAYPSGVLAGQRGQYRVRPFGVLLRTMLACDGLSRDEMIIGPLSAASDQSQRQFDGVCARIHTARGIRGGVNRRLITLSRRRKVQVNTLRNYTRWPIALMRDLEWMAKRSHDRKGRRDDVYSLTAAGRKVAGYVAASVDIRTDHLSALSQEQLGALSLFAHYRMLERSGFDVTSVRRILDPENPALVRAMTVLDVPPGADILFSPLQSLPIRDLERIFGKHVDDGWSVPVRPTRRDSNPRHRGHGASALRFSQNDDAPPVDDSVSDRLVGDLRDGYGRARTLQEGVRQFVEQHRRDSKVEFYPLVGELFGILGLRCETSRFGVNYERWDARLWVDRFAIPIEIKSPTEEKVISTKALRQAVENKIVLLARGRGPQTDVEATTLIVGFRLPSDRSDISSLIDDVYETYRIRVGVMDLHALTLAAMRRLCENVKVDVGEIRRLKGFLHAEADTTPARRSV